MCVFSVWTFPGINNISKTHGTRAKITEIPDMPCQLQIDDNQFLVWISSIWTSGYLAWFKQWKYSRNKNTNSVKPSIFIDKLDLTLSRVCSVLSSTFETILMVASRWFTLCFPSWCSLLYATCFIMSFFEVLWMYIFL